MDNTCFSRENLRSISLNEFDHLYKQQNVNTDRRQAHEAFSELLSQMNEESFGDKEEKEFKRLQDELINCNKNDDNKKIWVEDVAKKREREENAGEEQKESKKQRSNEEGSLTLSADMATATDAVADEVEDIEDGKWIVDGYDISSRFDNLRQTALSNKAAKKLTCLDKLHLNHVFFVSKTMQKSTLRFFPLAVKKNIVSASYSAAEFSLPLEVKAWIEEFEEVMTTVSDDNESVLKIADKEQKRMKQKARIFAQQAEKKEDPALKVYAEVFGCAARKTKRWGKTKLAETTFTQDRLSGILDCTFGSLDADLFHYNMQDKPMSSSSFEPGYLLSLNTCNSESIDLCVMEAKAPEAYKGDMDFVKISVMMKQMMDELISRGLSVDDAVVFGTILHGNQIYQYEMTLPYSGIYLMKEVSVGVLPSAVNDVCLFVDLVPRYLKIMDHLDQVAEAIELLPVEKAIHPYQRATAFYVKEKAE